MEKGGMSQPKRLVDPFGERLEQDLDVNRRTGGPGEELGKFDVGCKVQSEQVI